MVIRNVSPADKRQLLKVGYPLNLMIAIEHADFKEEYIPKELTRDQYAGLIFALSTLEEREEDVLWLRYAEQKSLSAIGEILSVTQERIRQIEVGALRKLRYPSVLKIIKNGITGYLKQKAEEEHERGYAVGYNVGYKDGVDETKSKQPMVSEVIAELPIENLNLSTRSYNCLRWKEYKTIGVIASLSKHQISVIRNLGRKSIREITQALHVYGIYDTDWDTF